MKVTTPSGRLLQQLAFIVEIDKLKLILRKTKLFGNHRHENDAEHSWHLAIMALVLAEHANAPVDMLRVLKMLLIHDVVEIDSGDVFLFDTQVSHTNTEAELKAAQRIFGLLPDDQAQELIELWAEFEAGETPDARFAKAMDRLAPLLQNLLNEGGTWVEYEVSYERILAMKQRIGLGSEALWAYAKAELDRFLAEGIVHRAEV